MNKSLKMKRVEWDNDKNLQLQTERDLSFEAIVVEIDDYLVLVPFVEDEEKIFLKTAFRSRKAMKTRQRRPKNEKA